MIFINFYGFSLIHDDFHSVIFEFSKIDHSCSNQLSNFFLDASSRLYERIICLSVHWSAANHFAAEDASLAFFFPLPQFFQMRPCISMRDSVCQYIGPSVGWLVHRSVGPLGRSVGRSVIRSVGPSVQNISWSETGPYFGWSVRKNGSMLRTYRWLIP